MFPFVIQQLFFSKNCIDPNNYKIVFLPYTSIKNHTMTFLKAEIQKMKCKGMYFIHGK